MKQLLFNPFTKTAGIKAFAIGMLFLLLSSFLAGLFGARYDGVLDMHLTAKSSFLKALYDNLINVASLTFFFYLFALIFTGTRTRFVDILGTVTLARFPMALIPLTNIGNFNYEMGVKMTEIQNPPHTFPLTITETIFLVLSVLFILLVIVWYVVLLYRAYAVSTNLKGGKMVGSFIVGLLLAEVCSKILIYCFV